MKTVKRITALLIVLVLTFSLSACHKQGEVAVASGDYEITSAMYSYYLVMADIEAKGIIDNDTENYDTTAQNFDYLKQTIDGKKYTDYVKELALKNCLTAIAYRKLCDENELELDTDTIANAEYTVSYYWSYYGYSEIFPENGVGYDTYLEGVKNDYFGDAYFMHLYDEGGEKAVSSDELQNVLDENFAAAYILNYDYSSETDADVDSIVSKMEGYKTRLANGESFKDIYNEYNEIKEEETTEETEESDEPQPQDEYISVVGSADTNSAFDKFDEVKAMALDEIKIISDTDNKAVYLVVKKDINSDSYYKETYLKSDLLYLVKGDEFEELISTYTDTLEYTVSDFAINQFKVKNIYYGA